MAYIGSCFKLELHLYLGSCIGDAYYERIHASIAARIDLSLPYFSRIIACTHGRI